MIGLAGLVVLIALIAVLVARRRANRRASLDAGAMSLSSSGSKPSSTALSAALHSLSASDATPVYSVPSRSARSSITNPAVSAVGDYSFASNLGYERASNAGVGESDYDDASYAGYDCADGGPVGHDRADRSAYGYADASDAAYDQADGGPAYSTTYDHADGHYDYDDADSSVSGGDDAGDDVFARPEQASVLSRQRRLSRTNLLAPRRSELYTRNAPGLNASADGSSAPPPPPPPPPPSGAHHDQARRLEHRRSEVLDLEQRESKPHGLDAESFRPIAGHDDHNDDEGDDAQGGKHAASELKSILSRARAATPTSANLRHRTPTPSSNV